MGTTELASLLRPLRRWWRLVLAGALLSGLAGISYLYLQPPAYASRTTLIVGSVMTNPNPSGAEISLAQQLAYTYADIAEREPLRQATLQALALKRLPYYTVQVLPNTQIIEIEVLAGDPQLSYQVASTLADQLILQGPAGREQQERESFVETELAELQASITETRAEIKVKRQELTTLFSAHEIDRTQTLIQSLEGKLSSLQTNYAALLATTQQGAANTLAILEPAAVPIEPTDSDFALNVIIAVIFGCTIAGGGAYLIEFLDDSFHTAGEVQEVLGAPVLTAVPFIPGETADAKLINGPNSPAHALEAYRLLRVNLEFTAIDHVIKLLVVAGASVQDGKTLSAANLAVAYARSGQQIILVDADLHRPTQQQLFKLANHFGLTTALRGEERALESLLQSTSLPSLRVLTAGPLPPNPAELLSGKRMQELLTQLKTLADLVIVDSPPLTTVTDGIVLATQADGVLMVVRAGKTRRTQVKRACAILNQVKARLLGVVYNGVAPHDSAYQADYGYYRYRKVDSPRAAT